MGMDDGVPLADPDPSRLGAMFGVDTALVKWKNGLWMPDPNAVKVENKVEEGKGAAKPEGEPGVPAAGGS
jgi:hypothetical protein